MSRFLPGMQIKVVVPAHHANYCQQVGCFSVDILGTFDDNTMMGIGIDIHNCHFFWCEKQTQPSVFGPHWWSKVSKVGLSDNVRGTLKNHWCHHSKPTPSKSPQAMVGTWKDAREISGHCLATACDDTGNSATLGDSSTAWVDMCGLVIGDR